MDDDNAIGAINIDQMLPSHILLLVFEHCFSPFTLCVDFVYNRWHISSLPGLELLLVNRSIADVARVARRRQWDECIVLQNWSSRKLVGLEDAGCPAQRPPTEFEIDLTRFFDKLKCPAWQWILEGLREIKHVPGWTARIRSEPLRDWMEAALEVRETNATSWVELETQLDCSNPHMSESTLEGILDGELDQVVQEQNVRLNTRNYGLSVHTSEDYDDGDNAKSSAQEALRQACVRLARAATSWRLQKASLPQEQVKVVWKQRYKNDTWLPEPGMGQTAFAFTSQTFRQPWEGYMVSRRY